VNWQPFPRGVRNTGADLNDVIKKYGALTTARKAMVCPCLDPETRRGDPNCVRCAGWGLVYNQDLVVTTEVIWVTNKGDHEQHAGGTLDPADYQCTWASTVPLGVGDLLVHPLEEETFHDTLQKAKVDPIGQTMERLRYLDVTAVERVQDEARSYTQNVDWALAADGRTVTWLGQLEPAAGSIYTVRYRAKGLYVIWPDTPRTRHEGADALPLVAKVQRFDPLTQQQDKSLGEVIVA